MTPPIKLAPRHARLLAHLTAAPEDVEVIADRMFQARRMLILDLQLLERRGLAHAVWERTKPKRLSKVFARRTELGAQALAAAPEERSPQPKAARKTARKTAPARRAPTTRYVEPPRGMWASL